MSQHSFRRATLEDAIALSGTLRAEDQAEIRAFSGRTPLEALVAGLDASDIPVAIIGDTGEVLAIFGSVPTSEPELGAIWLLAADALTSRRYRTRFIRECRGWIEAMHSRYPVLFNFVDARNTAHIRWLRWCGFSFIKLHKHFGAEHRPFWEFIKIGR